MTIVVTLYEDKDKPAVAVAVSNGFEQSIKWLGVASDQGDDGNDVFCWRYLKAGECRQQLGRSGGGGLHGGRI